MRQQAEVQPRRYSGRYRLEFAQTRFECDPAEGGRITAFGPRGSNFLIGPSVHPDNHGSFNRP